LSIGLVLSTTALSPIVTPFVLHMAGFVPTGDYAEDLHELASGGAARFLGIWVILPTLLGMAARYLAGDGRGAARRERKRMFEIYKLLHLACAELFERLSGAAKYHSASRRRLSRDHAAHRLSSLYKRLFIRVSHASLTAREFR
jgi:predicted Na+-dependent transporter